MYIYEENTIYLTFNLIITTKLIGMGVRPFEAETFVNDTRQLSFWIPFSVCNYFFLNRSLFFDLVLYA